MKRATTVSEDLCGILDHISGVSHDHHGEAVAAQMKALGAGGVPQPVSKLGMWFGGCYYVRTKRGTVKGKQGTWRRVYCIA